VEVTAITVEEDGKTAVAEYTTAYKNIPPFSSLSNIKLNKKPARKAEFELSHDGWIKKLRYIN
jgi:hypothetical protein